MQLTDPVAEAAMDCDSSSESGSEDNGPDDAALDEMQAAEASVRAEPDNYEVYAALVGVLRKHKMRMRLKDARARFSAKFPLHENLWLDWISDALEDASRGNIEYTEALWVAQQALMDYNTASLWQKYLQVLLASKPEVYTDPAEAVSFRKAAWQAISMCGADMAAGAVLYEALCDFECTNVQRLMEQHEAPSEQVKNAVEVAHAVWQQRASAALPGGDEALKAYKAWNDSLPNESLQKPITDKLQKALKRSKDAVTLRSSFEESISNKQQPAEDLLSSYLQYLKFERNQNPQLPGRQRVLLERAVERFPCTVEVWQQLVDYMEQQVGSAAVTAQSQAMDDLLACYNRACRNCPWKGCFWAGRLRAIECAWQATQPDNGAATESAAPDTASEISWAAHAQTYAEALQIGLDDENSYWLVISARLCACARHDRTALRTDGTQAATLISSYFPEAIDVHCNVVDLWASLEARHGATNEARELAWKPLLSRADTQQRRDVHKKYGWWEVQWGSIPTLREFYEWLLSRKKNVLPAAQRVDVAQNWVNAEERFGDIAHEMQARRMLTMLRVESQAEAAVTQNQEKKAADRGGKRKRPEEHEAGAGAPETGTQAPGKGKRSKNDATPAAAQHHNDTEAGKASGQERVEGAAEAGPGDGATGSAKAKQKKKKKAQGGVDGGGGMTGPKDGPAARIFTDKCTVFVQNLPEDVTGDDLKELFQDVKEARLPKAKGRAYVEFDTEDQLQKALELHGSMWRDAKLSVQRSAPPGRGGASARGGKGGRGRGKAGLSYNAAPSVHPHNRLGDAMVPRSVSKSVPAAEGSANSKEPKGNDDFKKLLGL